MALGCFHAGIYISLNFKDGALDCKAEIVRICGSWRNQSPILHVPAITNRELREAIQQPLQWQLNDCCKLWIWEGVSLSVSLYYPRVKLTGSYSRYALLFLFYEVEVKPQQICGNTLLTILYLTNNKTIPFPHTLHCEQVAHMLVPSWIVGLAQALQFLIWSPTSWMGWE